MTDATLDDLHADARAPAPASVELAASLAARLCPDLISPASAIVSGVDLLEDPSAADMREDALNLIGASARKLVAVLAFARIAFGASAAAESFRSDELRKLTEGVFAPLRPSLDWSVDLPELPKAAARALLNLAQLGAGAVATGGVVRLSAAVEGGAVLMAAECTGPRPRLRPEVLSGLRGEPLGEGLMHGHWVQAYYLHGFLAAAGGSVDAAASEERVTLRARAQAPETSAGSTAP